MEYKFYVDTFFITLCLVDFVALYGMVTLMKTGRSIRRCVILALVSAGIETGLYMMLPSYLLYRLLMIGAVNPLIVLGLFYPSGKSHFLRGYLVITGLFLFIGGIQTLFLYWAPIKRGGLIWQILLACVAVGLCLIQKYRGAYMQHECEVELQIHKQSIFLKAYHDTGNFLRDPFTGKPVSIVDQTMLELLNIPVENVRYIPFHSVGQSRGLIRVFTIDLMRIRQGDRVIELKHAVIGLSEKKLFLKQDIHMILHSELL